ncbi:unnamed protein product [Caenorhabditis bovis]|uniref:Major facilitator superfamily (MFS) profile domain-containing protein n=1 Tax=Caenorhabditis bovis TaxID=2654633 RepID=A0A8S1EIT9_9PELO|nr:unnamed protein product [Caenorhabditis bovis]
MFTFLKRGITNTTANTQKFIRNLVYRDREALDPLLREEDRHEVPSKYTNVHIRMPYSQNLRVQGSASLRTALVVLSIGAASHFLLFLDSVVDNLLPAAMPFLLEEYTSKEKADHAWELFVSSRIYGLAVGCFIAVLLSHRNGRKLSVILGVVLDIIGVIMSLLITYIPYGVGVATAGRLLNGIGQGLVQTAGSVMLSELPPIKKRGTALATLTMWACLGELGGMLISLDSILGRPSCWQWAMGFPLILLIPSLCILLKAPESPRYLFLANQENLARKAMAFYQNSIDGKQSIEEILVEKQYISKNKFDENGNSKKSEDIGLVNYTMERLKDGRFTRPLLVALLVQTFVHLDDWLWIPYSTQIFENYGLDSGTAQISSLLMSVPQAFISIGLLGCFDNFGRRTLLIVPTILSALFGFLAIVFGLSKSNGLPLLATLDLAVAAISGESAYAIVPELFLANDKVLATAIAGIVQNCFGGVLTSFLLTALNSRGVEKVLIPFVIMNVVYAALNYKFLPETAGKSPQEISRNYSQNLPGSGIFTYLKLKIIS